MPVARPEPQDARVIAHVDMDCFYVQVEQRKRPELRGLPTAVVQYNSWKGGGLIAVSYEARGFGVKRSMRGDEAKMVCPDIQLIQVPVAHGKADLNTYRNAGSEVVSVLAKKGRCERASIDEVYLDLTDAAESMLSENPPESLEEIHEQALRSHILGLNAELLKSQDSDCHERTVKEWLSRSDADHRDKLLACGAIIVADLRMQVFKETAFTCSAGIAHNKMLAKLASGMHKPAQQTVVPSSCVKDLLASFPIKKMKQLGGKLGSSLQSDLGISTVGDLFQFSEEKLQEHYGINTGSWLWNIARGISGDEVEGRLLPKSHGCGKTFPGPKALKTIASVEYWLNELCVELSERIQSDLDQNKRVAHTLTLHARAFKSNDLEPHKKFPSKSCPLRYGTAKIQEDALRLFESGLREFLSFSRVETHWNQNESWSVTSLSLSASKIFATPSGTSSILRFFQGSNSSCSSFNQAFDGLMQGSENCSEMNQVEQQKHEANSAENVKPSSDQDVQRIQTWEYKVEEIDHSMINELPSEIQAEVRGWMSTQIQAGLGSIYDPKPKGGPTSCPLGHMYVVRAATKVRSGLRGWVDLEPIATLKNEYHGRAATNETCNEDTFVGSSSNCGLKKVEQQRWSLHEDGQTENCPTISDQGMLRNQTWECKVEEIDPAVIDELPLEIQAEVKGWQHAHKRANTSKRGSSIAHYFLPAKKA